MNRSRTTASLLLAGLLASAGAFAQSTSSASSNVPLQAGEASTVSRGVPNMAPSAVQVDPMPATGTMGAAPADPAVVAPSDPAYGGRVVPRGSASVTSNVPTGAGEASTMTRGVPNARTYNPVTNDGRAIYPRGLDIATVPMQAGEASTMVNGVPNANPDDPVLHRRAAAMGYGVAPEWQVQRTPQ
jgi:hypothetical protein